MPFSNQKFRRYLAYAIVLFLIVLLILVIILVGEYRSLTRANFIQGKELHFSTILKNHGPLTAGDINIIQPWMTFDYINKIFNLPANYLRDALGITDSRYPKITLGAYIRHNQLIPVFFMMELKNDLQNYFNNSTNSTST